MSSNHRQIDKSAPTYPRVRHVSWMATVSPARSGRHSMGLSPSSLSKSSTNSSPTTVPVQVAAGGIDSSSSSCLFALPVRD